MVAADACPGFPKDINAAFNAPTELRNEACTEAENKSDIEGSHGGGIKGGIDVFGETWTSISSRHAMSNRFFDSTMSSK